MFQRFLSHTLLGFVTTCLFLTTSAMAQRGDVTTWTRSDGKKVDAEFKRMDGNNVVLLTKDGKEAKVPLNKLSKESQQMAKDAAKAALSAPAKKEPKKEPKNEPKNEPSKSEPSSEGDTTSGEIPEIPVVSFSSSLSAQEFYDIIGRELDKNNAAVLWDAMPSKYQSDIEELMEDRMKPIDPALTKTLSSTAKKLVAVLREKKSFVLNNPKVKQLPPSTVNMEKLYDPMIDFVETAMVSNAVDVSKLSRSQYRELMANSLGKLLEKGRKLVPGFPMADPKVIEKYTHLKVTKDSSGNESLNVDGQMIKLVNIEGRWLPEPMVQQWPQIIEQAKSQSKMQTPEMVAQGTAQVKFIIASVVLPTIAELKSAETQGDFDQLVDDKITMVQGMIGGMLGGAGGPGGRPGAQ